MHAVLQGNNIVCIRKNNINYGMTCAWVSMVGYEEISLLIGSQSDTGRIIEVGDLIGVSGLAKGQENIALHFGENHSEENEKYAGFAVDFVENVPLIEGAKTKLICKVIEKSHLICAPEDYFILCKIVRGESDKSKEFMPLEDVLKEE